MITTIEIKEITLQSGELFDVAKYECNGIHLVTDATTLNKVYVIISYKNRKVTYIGEWNDLKYIFEDNFISGELELMEYPEPIQNVVSESFALKAIAIAIRGNMVDFKDI